MDLLLSGCIATKLDRKLLGTLGVRMMASPMVGMGPHPPSLASSRLAAASVFSPRFLGPCRPSGSRGHPARLVVAAWHFFFFPILTLIARDSPSDPHQIRQLPHFPSSPAPQTGVLVVLKMSLFLLWGKRSIQAGKEEKTGVGRYYLMGWSFSWGQCLSSADDRVDGCATG